MSGRMVDADWGEGPEVWSRLTEADVRAWIDRWAVVAPARAAELDELDRAGGDGDHGTTVASAARLAASALTRRPAGTAVEDLLGWAATAAEQSGGACGPMLAAVLAEVGHADGDLGLGLERAAARVQDLGGARVGDKTLLDALVPAARAVVPRAPRSAAARAAAEAAVDAAAGTAVLRARRGRAAAVDGAGAGTADPGATSLAILLRTLADALAGPGRPTEDAEPAPGAVRTTAPPGKRTDGVGPATPTASPQPEAAAGDPHLTGPALVGKLVDPDGSVVDRMLDGLVAAHGLLVRRGPHPRVIVRATPKAEGRVGLAIANGSGHEPIAVGWVGPGLLDANGVGDVFTAPGPEVVAATVEGADRGAGVLLLVSNHAGDVVNATRGAELARAAGRRVELLVMGEDLATAPPDRRAERRGGPGTTVLYKVLGAAAEDGADLEELRSLGRGTLARTASLSVALRTGHHPVSGEPTGVVAPGTIVVGAGVHGEGGSGTRAWVPGPELVRDVAARVLDDLAVDGPFTDGERVLVVLNGAGGTTLLELWAAYAELDAAIRTRGPVPHRPLVGSLVTTQEAAGFSVSITRATPEVLAHWDAPCSSPAFPPPPLGPTKGAP